MKHKLIKITGFLLILSLTIFSGCKKKRPDTPDIPTGPSNCGISIDYNFTSSATDPDGDSIAIRFDWGDGDTSNWSAFVPSGDSVSMSHAWSSQGTYSIKAQAKDVSGSISNWTTGHQIVIITVWTKTYGGSDFDFSNSVQQTLDGGYIIAGWTWSFGAGNYDVYLIKTNANGDLVWQKTYGGSYVDWGNSVQQTSDGGYIIAGRTRSFGAGLGDVYLIKIDANGNSIWTKTYGGSNDDEGNSVQQTSDGGYIVAGETRSFGAGNYDVYLIKTDGNGDTVWTKTYGGSDWDYGYSVQQTSDGGYIIAGRTGSFGAGLGDVYLIKTDANGETVWTKTYGGSDWDYGYSVQQTSDGGYIITGETRSFGAGNYDVYLIKIDANGNLVWQKTFGGSSSDGGYSVRQTSDDGYIVAGHTESFGAGWIDVYLIKTNANGDISWTKTYGGINDDGVNSSVKQTSDGGYIIAGSTTSFGSGSSDVYVIKTDANGYTLQPDTSKMTSSQSSKGNEIKNRKMISSFDLRLPKGTRSIKK